MNHCNIELPGDLIFRLETYTAKKVLAKIKWTTTNPPKKCSAYQVSDASFLVRMEESCSCLDASEFRQVLLPTE